MNNIKIVFFIILLFVCKISVAQIKLDKSYKYFRINLPKINNYNYYSFSILPPDIPAIPILSGIFLPSDSIWFVSPKDKNSYIQSFAFGKSFCIYQINSNQDSTWICKSYPNKMTFIKSLPLGVYSLRNLNGDSLLIWGLNYKTKKSEIFLYNGENTTVLFSDTSIIASIYPINCSNFFISKNKEIIQYFYGKLRTIYISKYLIDGMSVDTSGNFYISDLSGVYKYDNHNKEFKKIISIVHGLLQFSNNKLFILWQEGLSIYVLY